MKIRHILACIILVILIGTIVLPSCSPRIIERVAVQHDTTRVVVRDSVRFYDRDSIFIKEKGDTVYKYVEKWRWRDRVHVDTFYKVQVDSVTVERVKEVKVEQPLTWWQKFRQEAFWWLAVAVLLLLIWTFRKFIVKLFVL